MLAEGEGGAGLEVDFPPVEVEEEPEVTVGDTAQEEAGVEVVEGKEVVGVKEAEEVAAVALRRHHRFLINHSDISRRRRLIS